MTMKAAYGQILILMKLNMRNWRPQSPFRPYRAPQKSHHHLISGDSGVYFIALTSELNLFTIAEIHRGQEVY
jgi:hypothetical protein